jgi:initiation factor 1A
MPNQHGGKAYKKGSKKKVQQQSENAKRFSGRDEGQEYARITRMLGNRRTLCFCNDGEERVGKIRGALCKGPKRQKIEVGDLVIVSLRSFDASDSDSEGEDEEEGGSNVITHVASSRKDVVDILEKVASSHWRQVRKEKGLHKDLLPTTTDGDGHDDIFEKEEEEVGSDIDIDDI